MKLEEIVEHLIRDCEKNIKDTIKIGDDTLFDYITSNQEAIEELEKVKTVKDLLEIFDENYIIEHFGLNSIEEIEE
jgi:hypothetical protein